MSWDKDVVTPGYHLARANEALNNGRKLQHGVRHNWNDIAYIHCELAIRAVGDKATDPLHKAADDISITSCCDHSVPDLTADIEKATKS